MYNKTTREQLTPGAKNYQLMRQADPFPFSVEVSKRPHTSRSLSWNTGVSRKPSSSWLCKLFLSNMSPCKSYSAFRNLWPPKTLHSQTLQKHNLKQMLSGMQIGAQTERQEHPDSSLHVHRWEDWGADRSKQHGWGHQPMSNVNSGNHSCPSPSVPLPFRRLPRYAFNITSLCVPDGENQK